MNIEEECRESWYFLFGSSYPDTRFESHFHLISFTLFILQRSRPLSMTSLWHHGSRLLSLIYGARIAPYDIILAIHLISQWPLSLLSVIRAVYMHISNCHTCTNRYRAVYKTGLTASLNNELSCSHSPIIWTLSSLPLRSSYSFVVTKNLPES